MRSRLRFAVLLEFGLLAITILAGWWLLRAAGDRWLARVGELAPANPPSAGAIATIAQRAWMYFAGGVIALALGRGVSLARSRRSLSIPLILPALALLCLLGLVIQMATVETTYRVVDGTRTQLVSLPSAGGFAQGFLLGAGLGAAILALRRDPATLLARAQLPILAGIVLIFAALMLVGTGPGASGTRINLGPIQPIEVVKPAFVAFLATYLGARAAKLRWQRQRWLFLRWPRPILLVPAVGGLVATFVGLFAVRDLGPTLILSLVFLGMFYVSTRASGWVLAALALVGALLVILSLWPDLGGIGSVGTRIRMWHDPWSNGLTHGHQLGEGLWAVAAGGFWGQGLGQAHTPLVPAGQTDLALAVAMEQIGFLGLLSYLVLLATLVFSGMHVAANNRTPERALLAAGLGLLLVIQWGIIHAGTFGLLPLTGIVVPFLSSGRSSMVAFVVMVAVLARLAEDARPREESEALAELRQAIRGVAAAAALLFAIGLGVGARTALWRAERISTSGIVARLADGTVVHRQNPRLIEIAERIRRGTISDRNGLPIAISPDPARPGLREYPLKSAFGTLLGRYPSRIRLPGWAIEQRWDALLRGYPERTGGPRYRDFGMPHAKLPLAWPDLRRFAPLLHLSRTERNEAIRAIDADIEARSLRVSIDGTLQREVAEILAKRVRAVGAKAAAAVVIDVDTGQILARAQVPDYDPGDDAWQEALSDRHGSADDEFWGVYGSGADKTHAIGRFQAGSVGKLLTALAAARRGWRVDGSGCDVRTDVQFPCSDRDEQGPSFTLASWPKPIHDFYRDSNHGTLDVVKALAVSCNVYFGQLGLQLGPEPFLDLVRAGVDVGYGNEKIPFQPGAPGSRQLASTGFGQGAAAMSVLQAARLVAAIAAGGKYRTCADSLLLGGPCEETLLVDDPRALLPILAGMRRVVTSGTGRRLERVSGIRIYGKTGTADALGFAGEELYGIPNGARAEPHAWFVAIAEREDVPECATTAPGRIAIAVVLPRGGTGGAAAGPAAVEIVKTLAKSGYLAPTRGDPE